MKETIAKVLYYNFHNWTTSWEQQDIHIKLPFYGEAEAVIKALEAEVPTSLMGCLLSDEEMIKVISKELGYEEDSIDLVGIEKEVAKAQLKKVAPYIEAQKQNLEIDLQMANDAIADYKGEIAELKASIEAVKKAERDKRVGQIYIKAGATVTNDKERKELQSYILAIKTGGE